jgi:hypothetical protein
VQFEMIGEADAAKLIETGSLKQVDLDSFTLHQLLDGRLLVDFLSGNCAVLQPRDTELKSHCRNAEWRRGCPLIWRLNRSRVIRYRP